MRVNIPLKKEKSLVNAILERRQEGRRRSRWRVAGGDCRRENEEEIKEHFAEKKIQDYPFSRLKICHFSLEFANSRLNFV